MGTLDYNDGIENCTAMNLKDTYNKIAKDWAKDHYADTWWVEGTNKFISFLKQGSHVLDVGCGTGVKSKYLLDHGLKVDGIDFSESMIEIARREVPGASFSVVDITDLGGVHASFDGILAQAVLLHIPKEKIVGVLSGLRDKLKAGGYLYIAVKEKKEDEHEEGVVKENDYGYEYERFFSYYTLTEIRKYIDSIGMKILYENVALSGRRKWIQVVCQRSV